MPTINLKDYDNCEKLGHDWTGIGNFTSYCVRCNLDRDGYYMPKSYWKRPKRKMKGEIPIK